MAYEVERPPGRFAKQRESAAVRMRRLVVGHPARVAYTANHFANQHLDIGIRWGKGGNAEVKVGGALEALRHEGFVVMHDLDQGVAGNVDHLVGGPRAPS